jgi:hypothetical protein
MDFHGCICAFAIYSFWQAMEDSLLRNTLLTLTACFLDCAAVTAAVVSVDLRAGPVNLEHLSNHHGGADGRCTVDENSPNSLYPIQDVGVGQSFSHLPTLRYRIIVVYEERLSEAVGHKPGQDPSALCQGALRSMEMRLTAYDCEGNG